MVKLPNPLVMAATLCAIAVYSGMVRVQSRTPFYSLFSEREIRLLTGTVSSNPTKTNAFSGSYRMDFSVESVTTAHDARSSAAGIVSVYIPSDVVESLYPGKLYTPSRSQSGILIDTGSRLSLSVTNGIKPHEYLVNSVKSLGWGSGFYSRLCHFRALCRLQFRRLMFAWGKAGGLLLALLSGSREYTEGIVSDSFRNAGLSHILALSGMHLSLFSGLALFLGKKAATRTIADGLQLGAILFFVWFAGLSPSLFRAMLCALVLFASSILRMNRPAGVTVLSVSFLMHLVIFPDHLQTAAFMLSYGALAGILIVSVAVKRLFSRRFLPRLTSALSDSAAAQLFTAPVTLRLFGKLMPVGIVASVLVSPLVVYFLYAGLLGIVLCLAVPFLSPAIGGILNRFYELIKTISVFFAQFPALAI
ncbi:MAG: ComEC/Rec2 family competence protein [Treponema sp.]|nr:ComEC/Rec2 family competence protein [Treponema sp.]